MKMHNPPHPGEVLKTLCLESLNLTITEAARSLGISRKTLSGILNARAGISPEMAVRLSIAFNTSAESWLNQQLQYDPWHYLGRQYEELDLSAEGLCAQCAATPQLECEASLQR